MNDTGDFDPRNPHGGEPHEPAFRKATRMDIINMGELLKQHCHKLADGTAEYEKGWDDDRVAKTVNTYLSYRSAADLRRDLIGNFGSEQRGRAVKASNERRLVRMERAIERIARKLSVGNAQRYDFLRGLDEDKDTGGSS